MFLPHNTNETCFLFVAEPVFGVKDSPEFGVWRSPRALSAPGTACGRKELGVDDRIREAVLSGFQPQNTQTAWLGCVWLCDL